MTLLIKELEKIEGSLNQIPVNVIDDRIDLAGNAGMSSELLNGGNSIIGLKDDYYKFIKKYATERAYYIENSVTRLDLYDINQGDVWNRLWSTGFTFPTTSEIIVYCYLDDGSRVNIVDGYNLITKDGELVTYYQSITIQPASQIPAAYSVETVSINGIPHEKIILSNPITLPSIGDEFALMKDGRVVGVARVGVEGLGLNTSWDATDIDIDPYVTSDIDVWYSDITDLPIDDFILLCGEFITSGIPTDDVLRSADPSLQAITSKPYTQSKLENSPFFPALNTDETTWPTDFTTIDVNNRKLTIDGVDYWAVYPQFRWEGKLIPSLSANPNSEELPGIYHITDVIQFFNDMAVSVDDFPINSGTTESSYEYYWDELTDLIYGIETINGVPAPAFAVDCTYNSISYKIKNWDSEIQTFFSTVVSVISTDVNTIDNIQYTIDQDHLDYIYHLEMLLEEVRTEHDTWFETIDDGDTNKFNTDFGEYDLSVHQVLDNELSNDSIQIFNDRISNLETVIGSASNRSGYVGKVINAADTLVNRNYGFLNSLKKSELSVENSKEILTQLRRKYDVYKSGV